MKQIQQNHLDLSRSLIQSYISEKTNLIAEKHKHYVFKTHPDVSKSDIKNILERYFNVKVNTVRVCNVTGKKVNFKQRTGKRNNWKKAYVVLQKGYNIDFTKDVKIK